MMSTSVVLIRHQLEEGRVVDLEHWVYSLTYLCYVTTVKSCFTVQ